MHRVMRIPIETNIALPYGVGINNIINIKSLKQTKRSALFIASIYSDKLMTWQCGEE